MIGGIAKPNDTKKILFFHFLVLFGPGLGRFLPPEFDLGDFFFLTAIRLS